MSDRRVLIALYGLPLGLLLGLVVGPIVRGGMFIDGLVYTNIAKNLYYGHGSFWAPVVDVGGPVFHGHPVLLPWVQSGFFYLLGDHAYTEDVYNASVLLATLAVMYIVWRGLAGRANAVYFCFPLLLFVASEEVQLRYPNTLLECGLTLIVLTTTAVFLYLHRRYYRWGLVAVGLGAVIAFFAKGPPGLFVLGVPFVHGLVVERRWRWGAVLVPPAACIAAVVLLCWQEPAALIFLRRYGEVQVLASLRGQNLENVATSRWAILVSVVMKNLPALLASGLLLLVRPVHKPEPEIRRAALFAAAVAATALLPLTLSLKQADYYQLPGLPFLFFGLTLFLLPRLRMLPAYLGAKAWKRRLLMGLTAVIVLWGAYRAYTMSGTIDPRDRLPYAQAHEIARLMDSLGSSRYRLVVTGERHRFDNSLAHTLTGFLNRFHGIYQAPDSARVVLYLRTSGGHLPPPDSVRTLYRAEEVLLIEQ